MNDPDLSFISAISDVGFPIFLTAYLLIRFEKRIDILTKSILSLTNVIKGKSTGPELPLEESLNDNT